ncbi:MAG: CHASE2 domain-containing protein [Gammaproteobacteria bacterium]|nr:CHASE2 domain-containing protein [Gammaproteobacteria bacterium]
MAKKRFWQAGWFPGLLISAFFLSLGWTGFMSSLEWQAYGLGARLSPAPTTKDNLEIVAIDEASLQQLGEWPWPRSYLGVVIKHLNTSGARTVGLAIPLHTPQSEFGVKRLDSMRDTYEGKYQKTVKEILFLARQRLDTDGALAASLRRSDNTVLAITYGVNQDIQRGSLTASQQALESFAFSDIPADTDDWRAFVPSVLTQGIAALTQAQSPIPLLARHSAAGMLDESITGRRNSLVTPLVLKSGDKYYPSFSLMFAAQSLKIKTDDVLLSPQQDIIMGGIRLNTDPGYRVYPHIYRNSGNQPAFKLHSFHNVYADSNNSQPFKGKDVLIGVTARSLVDPITLPDGESMAPIMANAHLINNLLHSDMFRVPEWALTAQLTAFAVVALYLIVILPRFRFWTGFVTSLMLLFILINFYLGLMIIAAMWVPLMLPVATLLSGALAIASIRKIDEAHQRTEAHLTESNLALGMHFQSQGILDQAFEKYRECPINTTLLDRLYNLGLDYERRRQFSKAAMVFEYIDSVHAGFRDVKQRMQKNREIQEMVVLPKNGKTTDQGTLILTDNGVQKPMLGRYQIEKEIGRGAMGMVYLGKDPKIGRTVAIKTMALAQEFDPEELEEIKQRFLREAETAGRLNHQNIVTIFDVGEEQELAYIAMDYLKGHDLSHHKQADSLLPIDVVLSIGIEVASALDFAHKHEVVHRDIKPANIVYDQASGSVKVTDFGVACLTNSSRTKTGTMLGSPSYMSPEQVDGKKVDGGSDLFSLGATLYQLSTGQLPFVSDTLAGLTHKICHEKQIDANKVRDEVPACLSRIINKALRKQREDRYKTGAQMAKTLRMCRDSL